VRFPSLLPHSAAVRLRSLALALALLGALVPRLHASDTALEYRVKAGYLFHFAQFVEWPQARLPAGAPIRIGLVAPADVCAAIEGILAEKTVDGHPVVTERLVPEAVGTHPPHILFVHRSADISPALLAQLLGGQPVLIVGETSGFATQGGIIGFVTRGDNLHFQINLGLANGAGLHVSSQMATASMAEIVHSR
jgi:hypothetical protein